MDWFLYDNGLRHEELMKSYDYFENVISNFQRVIIVLFLKGRMTILKEKWNT